jgi:hypothetical protein
MPDGLFAARHSEPYSPSKSCLASEALKGKKQRHKKEPREVSPVTMLTDELDAVRRDLRRTIRAYAARLELDLAESIAAVTRYKRAEELSRERLHDIRDLTIMMRKRKLKPEKGRRKDVRKLDLLIRDLHSITQPSVDCNDSK